MRPFWKLILAFPEKRAAPALPHPPNKARESRKRRKQDASPPPKPAKYFYEIRTLFKNQRKYY
jgi:hypothetical protein